MTEGSPQGPDPQGGFWPDWLTPKRAVEFVRNVVVLEASVKRLQQENRDIRLQMAKMSEQLAEQNGQLQLLVGFVKGSIDEKIELRVERAVFDVLKKLSVMEPGTKDE